jgi:1-acyl-sn-glycerol-3-phosphate acyltransferase
MKTIYLKIIGHVFLALWQVTIYFPLSDQVKKDRMIKRWCNQLLEMLEINLPILELNSLSKGRVLIVSNHISWLDIMVINAITPTRFVAKSEVKKWPIFGYFADQLNTLYIQRNNRGDVQKMVVSLIDALNDGQRICIFPEGTSSDGRQILEFRSNLFEAVIGSNATCVPIALVYKEANTGSLSTAPAYIGEMGLIDSIKNIVKSPPIDVLISVGEISGGYTTRKELSDKAWQKISEMHQLILSKA